MMLGLTVLIGISAIVLLTNAELSAAELSEYSGSCGANVTYEFDSATGTLTINGSGEIGSYRYNDTPWYSYREQITSIVIGDSVTAIGNNAFYDCTNLTSVSIPESVTSIGSYAFADCCALTQISIPHTVTEIQEHAFYNCLKLAYLTIPDSITTVGSHIVYGDFCDTDGETEIEPEAQNLAGITFKKVNNRWVKVITGNCGEGTAYEWSLYSRTLAICGSGAIENYSASDAPWYPYRDSIGSIVIGDSVTSIGDYAFCDCGNLNSVTIPNSVTAIGKFAFQCCISLTSVDLHGPVTSIGDNAFKGCTALASVSLPDSLENIGAGAFQDSNSLGSVILPNSVISIGDNAFEGVSSIGSVSIPDSVETIGCSAFENCTKLATVYLGRSVSLIDDFAFYGCTSLASISVSDENGVYCSADGVLFSKDMTELVQYPVAKAGTSYEIPDTVKTIGSSSFEECKFLTSLTFADSVETIEVDAFDMVFYDPAGENVLEQTVENLAGSIFDSKDGKWVKQAPVPPVNPDKISGKCGDGAIYELDPSSGALIISGSGKMNSYSDGEAPWFPHRASIRSVEIADTVTSIGNFAFEGIASVESIYIPDSVETIGASAFESCSNLVAVNIGKSVCSIGESAFKGCTSLASYVVSGDNNTYSSIDGVLFCKDGSVLIQYPVAKADASYAIPDTVTFIAPFAFKECAFLTSTTIPDSVETIGASAFDGCTGLRELTLPASLNCVGSNDNPCFSGCVNIEKFTFTKGDGTWYSYETGISQTVSPSNGSGILNDSVFEYLSEHSDYRYTPWQLSRSALTTVTISEGVTSVGDSAFKDCTAINSLTLGNTVAVIGDSAFSDCTSLATVVIPDSVATIGESAFSDCKSLTSIVIPDSVTAVGDAAFSNCTALKSVTLPDSAGSIGESVFGGCSSLNTFNIGNENSDYSFENGVLYNKNKTVLIQYLATNPAPFFVIPATVRSICSYAFQDNDSLSSITFSDSVKSIGESAFSGKFYDADGTEIVPAAENLAGSTFYKKEDNWIRHALTPVAPLDPTPSDDNSGKSFVMIYVFVFIIALIALSSAVVVITKKKHI